MSEHRLSDAPIPTGPLRWKPLTYQGIRVFDRPVLQQWCITPDGFRWVDVPAVSGDAPDDVR